MKNNPEVNIRTDFEIGEIVKPPHMNALAASVQYDYVVTEEMIQKAIEAGATEIDVDDLLGRYKIAECTGEYSVLINALVDSGYTLKFDGSSVGGPSGELRVHVYALGPYTAKVNGNHPNVIFYFHTRGENGAVTLMGIGRNTYVGSFNMTTVVQSSPNAKFIYEMALGELPTLSGTGGTIKKAAWMSNSIGNGGGGSSNVLKLCAYGTPYNTFDVNPSHTDPEDIDGRALNLEGYDSVEWSTNLACEDHVEAEYGIQLDAPFTAYDGSIVLDVKPTVYINPENCKGGSASFTIKSNGDLPIEDGASIEFNLDGIFTATGLSGGLSVRSTGTIKYTGVTISGANVETFINGGVEAGGDISGTIFGTITGGGISGEALSFGFSPKFSGKISGNITGAGVSTGASLSGTGTIQILDEEDQPVITLNVTSGAITSGEINEAKVTPNTTESGGTTTPLPRITKFIPARYLTIDPDTMVEGKVYPIHVKCWNRGAIMSCSLLLNGTFFYPVYLHNSSARAPETVDSFSKFGCDAKGFYMIDSSMDRNRFAIKSFDGYPLYWTGSYFETDMTTIPASGFGSSMAKGAHNAGRDGSAVFTASHPDTPGASFSLFEIRILNTYVYLLNNISYGLVRPKMVTVAPPGDSLMGQCESPAPYAGTVYLMKKNGKVYALGY